MEKFQLFKAIANKLLVSIKSNELFQKIYDATKEYYPDAALTEKTLVFVAERCMAFLQPLSVEKSRTSFI